jgi:hypothetical protein
MLSEVRIHKTHFHHNHDKKKPLRGSH